MADSKPAALPLGDTPLLPRYRAGTHILCCNFVAASCGDPMAPSLPRGHAHPVLQFCRRFVRRPHGSLATARARTSCAAILSPLRAATPWLPRYRAGTHILCCNFVAASCGDPMAPSLPRGHAHPVLQFCRRFVRRPHGSLATARARTSCAAILSPLRAATPWLDGPEYYFWTEVPVRRATQGTSKSSPRPAR